MQTSIKLFLILTPFILGACESVDSDDIRTSGVYADFKIASTGSGTSRIRARLGVGGVLSNTDLELEDGDQLIVITDTESGTMREDKEFFGGTEYKYTAATSDENTLFRINFNRPSGVSAPNSSVSLPAPVTFTAPTTGSVFQRSDTINISWTPVSVNMTNINVKAGLYQCNVSTTEIGRISKSFNYRSATDFGGTSVNASNLFSTEALAHESLVCDITLTVTRIMTGVIDPAYEGGSILATQSDEVVIRVEP